MAMTPSVNRFCGNLQRKRKEIGKQKDSNSSSDNIIVQIKIAFAEFKILRLQYRFSSELQLF